MTVTRTIPASDADFWKTGFPGECTWGVFWFPQNQIEATGPYECNNSSGVGEYEAQWDNVTFSGSGSACATGYGFPGKPCAGIHP